MSLFGKKSSSQRNESLLDQKLYDVPGTNSSITWADSLEGTLITGSTGSGKTSGPGKHVAMAMLKSDFGMCILCAKPEERERWIRYVKDTGREKDLIIFNKESGLKFNFLNYEMERGDEGGGDVLNAINILMNLNEQSRVYRSGSGGNKDERFWDESLRRLISRSIGLLNLAGEEINIYNMRKIVVNCFREQDVKQYIKLVSTVSSSDEIDLDDKKKAIQELEEWKGSNYFVGLIERVLENGLSSTKSEYIMDYWLKEFAYLSEKTVSIISESFMGVIEPFMNDGILNEQFSHGLDDDLLPENIILDHKILIIDFPIKQFGLSAIFASTIYKTAFQAACERRVINEEQNPKPVGLFIDEYQSFCNPVSDSLFQATARSSWVACVYITQNINNLYFVMGDSQPEARANSLLGNLNLKYFSNNADFKTNEWASEMIGKHFIDVPTYSYSKEGGISKSKTHQYHHKIPPDFFTTLKTGRKANGFKVGAVAFKSGKSWGNDQNFAQVEFDQR